MLTRWLSKGFQKQDLLCIWIITMYFEVNNFRNTKPWGSYVFKIQIPEMQ